MNLPGKMLFIHIAQGEVIPRGGPELAFYLPSQTEHKKAEPFLNHRLVTELGKQSLIGSAPLLQSAEECSLGEWRAARSTLPSRQLLPVSSGSIWWNESYLGNWSKCLNKPGQGKPCFISRTTESSNRYWWAMFQREASMPGNIARLHSPPSDNQALMEHLC